MTETNLTPQQELNLINSALKQTARIQTGASNYYIIWGSVLLLYYFAQFLSLHFKTSSLANWSNLLFAAGGILSYLQKRKDERTETVVPLQEKVFTFGWMAAAMGLGVLCLSNIALFPQLLCLGVLLLFGIVNFIIGGVIRFTPLVAGGVVSALLALTVFQLSLDYVFLTTSFGVLCSCLLPGILMKKEHA